MRLLAAVACMWAAAAQAAGAAPPRPQEGARFFDRRVAPILKRRCLACHNEELKDGGISFLDRASLLKGGSRGAAVVPGRPEESFLLRAIRHDGDVQMPPGPRLPAKEIATLTEWIRRGAPLGTQMRVSSK